MKKQIKILVDEDYRENLLKHYEMPTAEQLVANIKKN
jgi:hypothetical protein